jgi:hypothetical protein
MPTYRIVKEVRASPAVVWSVLADYPGMTKWAGASKVTIEQQVSTFPTPSAPPVH